MENNKVVKIINNQDNERTIVLSDNMKFSELVDSWSFLTGFMFDITEGKDEGIKALHSNNKQLQMFCKAIFYPVFKKWSAYLNQVNENDNTH